MWRNKFWEWWDKYSGFVIGPTLVVFGILIGLFWQVGVLYELSVALIIAGVLTVAVDPFVKRKIRREATRDIFHHMLGFKLPEQIRDRLQEIVENTKFYRENTTMHCVLSESGDALSFEIEFEFEIVNPTQHTVCFEPLLEFERGEHAVLKKVVCFGEADYGKNATLTPNPQEQSVFAYRGPGISIPSGGRKRFKYEYSTQYPVALGFFVQTFQYPTIGFALTIKPPVTLVASASPAESQSVGEWRYKRLFMPHDHIDIRWETKP